MVDDVLLRRIRRQETWTARILRTGDRDAIEAAERDWWAATSASERVIMVDAVSADAFALSEGEAHELRLQRSVTRIRRRRGLDFCSWALTRLRFMRSLGRPATSMFG
jgi:hypothetical protein